MSPTSRRKSTSIVANLIASPHAYSFYQAVRILERATLLKTKIPSMGDSLPRAKNFIAGFAPPSSEILRVSTQQSLAFPNAEIHAITSSKTGESLNGQTPPWLLRVNFMGLTGCMGVMPYHYTELILQRLKQKDEALAHFLDLFNHRTLSLFYQASRKYSLPLQYERKSLQIAAKKTRDLQTQTLLSLIGIGTTGLQDRLQISDESLICYSGLLTQQIRTAGGLRQILQDYFAIPVEIQEFVGQWQELIPDVRTRIACCAQPKGQNAQLGHSTMLGHKGWFAQGKIRISLGPLNRAQFYKFAPGTASLRALNDLVRLYVGIEHDYDFIITVRRRDIPRNIRLEKQAPPILGWNTWLSSSDKFAVNGDDIVQIRVSANRLK